MVWYRGRTGQWTENKLHYRRYEIRASKRTAQSRRSKSEWKKGHDSRSSSKVKVISISRLVRQVCSVHNSKHRMTHPAVCRYVRGMNLKNHLHWIWPKYSAQGVRSLSTLWVRRGNCFFHILGSMIRWPFYSCLGWLWDTPGINTTWHSLLIKVVCLSPCREYPRIWRCVWMMKSWTQMRSAPSVCQCWRMERMSGTAIHLPWAFLTANLLDLQISSLYL